MEFLLDLIRSHGSRVLFAAAFLENLGIPLPAAVFLILSGCLVVEGSVSPATAFLAAIAGALLGDLPWYLIGRLKGRRALYLICRLSLNPDACVGRTEQMFRSRTALTILTAKLMPGLSTVIPPLAGILRMPLWRYVLIDLGGCALWSAAGLGLGLAFGTGILPRVVSIQRGLLLLFLTLTAAYATWRLFYRRYLISHYSVPRLDSAEVLERISSGAEVMVVDLRNEEAYHHSDATLPGAVRIPPAEFDRHLHLLPKEKEIILYCT